MMMDDKEDGELSGSGPEDTSIKSDAATAAAAVPSVSQVTAPLFAYRSSNRGCAVVGSSDDDQSSDGDSDDDNCHLRAPAKRRRKMVMPENSYSTQPAFSTQQKAEVQRQFGSPDKPSTQQSSAPGPATVARPHIKPKRRNNIWANVLGEQTLSDDISVVGLKKLEGDRSVENYDFRGAQELMRKQRQQEEKEDGEIKEDGELKEDGEMNEDGELNEEDEVVERMTKRLSRKRPMASRVYRPTRVPPPACEPGEALQLPTLVPSDTWTDEICATAIAEALQEQKPQMIRGVVQVLGREKTLQIYTETKRVENEGGMIILNGERRRTSGGVFLQLVKKENLSKDQLNIVFPPDEGQQLWRKRKRAVHRRKNRDNRRDNTDNWHGSDGQSAESSSRLSDRSPRLQGSDSNDATDVAGSKCPGSTPVTTPGPTPTTTPIVTPHCSDDDDDDASRVNHKMLDTALAIVKAASPAVAGYDEDFLDASAPVTDEMDVL